MRRPGTWSGGRADTLADLKGLREYSEDSLVSVDVVGNPHSCIFDWLSTMVSGSFVKVAGWYDNEWGYSCRVVDLAVCVGARL